MYVMPDEKVIVLTATKRIIKQENNQQITTQEEYVLNTLIYSIIKEIHKYSKKRVKRFYLI